MPVNPPRIYQFFILLIIALYVLLPGARLNLYPWNLLGLPVFFGGAWLALSAKRCFQQAGTPLAVTATPDSLHESGAFRYSRNPMYLGIAIGLAGVALLFSAALNFIFPVLFVVLMDVYFVPREEQTLADTFGKTYDNYRARVRRWL